MDPDRAVAGFVGVGVAEPESAGAGFVGVVEADGTLAGLAGVVDPGVFCLKCKGCCGPAMIGVSCADVVLTS